MSIPKKIRRFWMWVGIIMLIELAAITLWKRWYWFFPSHTVSEVYTRYAGTEGLNVAFLKDFKINDSVFVDVTLFEAKTDTVWTRIGNDFNLASIPDEILSMYPTEFVSFRYAPKKNYSLPMDSCLTNNDVLVISYQTRTIAAFHIESEEQIMSIIKNQISKNKALNNENE